MQPELKFQKEMVISATRDGALAEITTHRFKKGWPDLYWKYLHLPATHIECKCVDASSCGSGIIKIGTTELQKLCLKKMRAFGVVVGVVIKVTVDKKHPKVYTVFDIDREVIELKDQATIYYPQGGYKGKLLWPVLSMTRELINQSESFWRKM